MNFFLIISFIFLGECIPVTKTQLPHADNMMPWMQYSGEDYKRHVLFCGTEVIRTESTMQGPAKAVVLRTGNSVFVVNARIYTGRWGKEWSAQNGHLTFL